MARQQFDHQIKSFLEKREIKPSAKSWDRLSQRLDSEEKKQSPVYWWVGIAATIVGGILIFSMVFNNVSEESPAMVETPLEKMDNKENYAEEKIIIASEDEEKFETVLEIEKSSDENKPKQKSQPVLTNNVSQMKIASQEIKPVSTKQENLPENIEGIGSELIQTKLQEVIAEISLRGNAKGDAFDAEIDALLMKAAGEISSQQSREGFAAGLNAEDLLWDVEMEIEQSFREKVFDLLKEGYSKAKTAVANRNN